MSLTKSNTLSAATYFIFLTNFNIWELNFFLMKSWIWLLLWIHLILHGWYVEQCFGRIDVLAWSMFWQGQCFGAVYGLALLMFWYSRCFGTVDILEPLMFWRSRTNASERQSLRDLKYLSHLYTYCTKTLTALKHYACQWATFPEGPQISTSPIHRLSQIPDCGKTLTAPKHWSLQNIDQWDLSRCQ